MDLAHELKLHVAVLELIARRREETGDYGIGLAIERCILDRHIRALSDQIVADPGALAGMLVPVRRGRA